MKHKNATFNPPSKEEILELSERAVQRMQENEGMTLQQALGIGDEILEEVYNLAYSYYNQGDLKASSSLFQFLAQTSPRTYKYVLGLASSLHQQQNYREAALAFIIAQNLEIENPMAAYYAADCLLKENLVEEAYEMLDVAIEIANESNQYNELKERCKLIKKSIKSK